MTDLKAIIFDCDGVLFQSHRANLAFYNKIFAEFDSPLILDPHSKEAHICHTASSPVVLTSLMQKDEVAAALRFSQTLDYREFIPLMAEDRDLKPALRKLAETFPLAVATNRGNSMQEVLEHFEIAQYFQVVVTSRDVEKPKPAPDMLLLAASRLGVSPCDCLFIGDSELDQMAALEGGVPFVSFGASLKAASSVQTHTELVKLLLEGMEL
jgi:HAD superfamily hydrolase (TIGR01509 family)